MRFRRASSGREGYMVTGLRRGMFTLVAVLAVLVVPVALQSAEDDVSTLLRGLRIEVPPQAVPAPAFSLQDVNGKPVHLTGYKGRPVMLYFWTTY
jgi:cytochrome oxidase Cu insertion factor (SCO1/SenC/PrrC family)